MLPYTVNVTISVALTCISYIISKLAIKIKYNMKTKGELLMNNHKTSINENARQERIAYYRSWRAKNRDKVRQHNLNYWEKRGQKRLESEVKDEVL